jgi:hypothetical protein
MPASAPSHSHDLVPPTVCDHCGAALKATEAVPHPEKGGSLQVYECTACKLPMVQYVPQS